MSISTCCFCRGRSKFTFAKSFREKCPKCSKFNFKPTTPGFCYSINPCKNNAIELVKFQLNELCNTCKKVHIIDKTSKRKINPVTWTFTQKPLSDEKDKVVENYSANSEPISPPELDCDKENGFKCPDTATFTHNGMQFIIDMEEANKEALERKRRKEECEAVKKNALANITLTNMTSPADITQIAESKEPIEEKPPTPFEMEDDSDLESIEPVEVYKKEDFEKLLQKYNKLKARCSNSSGDLKEQLATAKKRIEVLESKENSMEVEANRLKYQYTQVLSTFFDLASLLGANIVQLQKDLVQDTDLSNWGKCAVQMMETRSTFERKLRREKEEQTDLIRSSFLVHSHLARVLGAKNKEINPLLLEEPVKHVATKIALSRWSELLTAKASTLSALKKDCDACKPYIELIGGYFEMKEYQNNYDFFQALKDKMLEFSDDYASKDKELRAKKRAVKLVGQSLKEATQSIQTMKPRLQDYSYTHSYIENIREADYNNLSHYEFLNSLEGLLRELKKLRVFKQELEDDFRHLPIINKRGPLEQLLFKHKNYSIFNMLVNNDDQKLNIQSYLQHRMKVMIKRGEKYRSIPLKSFRQAFVTKRGQLIQLLKYMYAQNYNCQHIKTLVKYFANDMSSDEEEKEKEEKEVTEADVSSVAVAEEELVDTCCVDTPGPANEKKAEFEGLDQESALSRLSTRQKDEITRGIMTQLRLGIEYGTSFTNLKYA